MKKIALFPGSFDPFTLGHHDIVLRSLSLFDEIIIGIGKNSQKTRYFSLEELMPKIEAIYINYTQIKVKVYEELTADFARSMGAKFIVRGLRNTTDFEYENSIAEANKFLWREIETIFLITTPQLASISSTIIRDIHKYGKNVDTFLPYKI